MPVAVFEVGKLLGHPHWSGRYPARVTGDIVLNFIDHKGLHVQAMALDCRTILGSYVPVASVDTLRRMLAYLGCDAGADRRL